jgi:LacI family transcriptional regulator
MNFMKHTTIRNSNSREPKSAGGVTLKQVAAHAGVSYGSASVVLNGTRSSAIVGEEARSRIMAAAAELGYRKNGAAQAIKRGRFGSVSLLMTARFDRSVIASGMMDGVYDCLERHNLHLSIVRLQDELLTSEEFIPTILEQSVSDGLIVSYETLIPPRLIELIQRFRIPAVWVNSKQSFDSVYPDDTDGGWRAAKHLLDLGHSHIGYTVNSSTHHSVAARWAGYEKAMRDAHLPTHLYQDPADGPDWIEYWCEVLRREDRPTAVIAYNEMLAHPVIQAAIMCGINVPHDLSVVTFHHEPAGIFGVELSTWLIPFRKIGDIAAEMLVQKIQHPEEVLANRILSFDFHEGKTCAPPSQSKSL